MVFNRVLKQLKPEERELGKNAALVRNPRGEHMVKGGDTVGSDKEKLLVAEVVDVADLAARDKGKVTEAGLEKGLAH
ncbi:hypothetical protein GCM10011585_18440 [Edaphobacter dinghuensis]|uniref:Uncharacterized protein n=1 Tax=Edaphobacter dinghuensis TaxID=1560005 RepID=A0A917HDL6_9BACT|nr:hypothetical protein GCM10011585_18440 [Edaphobacter dinghuensis]